MSKRTAIHFASISTIALSAALLGTAAPVLAQTWTGNTSNDWMDGSNWSGSTVPAGATVNIDTMTPNPTVLGVSGAETAVIGALNMGSVAGASSLTIQNGSALSNTTNSIGYVAGSTAVVTVTGSGTTWTMTTNSTFGNLGNGTLNISDGASVNASVLNFGGANSGVGTLNITNGGQLNQTGNTNVGGLAGTGFATISGVGSRLSTAGNVIIGFGLSGTMTVEDGGTVRATTVTLGSQAAASGTLNLTSGGVLEAQTLRAGAGTVQANFDGGVLQARAANATFISAFTGTELNLLAGGLTVDTAGFAVGTDASSGFSGTGGLTVTGGGTGTLSLLGSNSYTGATTIETGTTLALSGSGSIENSSRVVADGTFDISAITPPTANIQSLAGGGTVNLGTKTLALTNANNTFAGSITGTGGLTVSAGSETLTGTSTYAGATNVNGTGHLRILDGGQITNTGDTTLDGPSVAVTVGGTGSLLHTDILRIGGSAGSNATLSVLDGGVVQTTSLSGTSISGTSGQTATVNVDGAGSRFDLSGVLGVGHQSEATNAFLNITNGGAVQSASGTVGAAFAAATTGTKSVLISGAGSSWTMSGTFTFRRNASVAIINGGSASALTSNITGGAAGEANLLVSGAGSTYSVTNDQVIGAGDGTGYVTVADGAHMSVGGQLTLASAGTATGILNIGGAEGQAATGAGILDAATLAFGDGTGRLNFNHTDANYTFSTIVSGAGIINHTGPGRTNVTSDSSAFTGSTFVSAGTLAVNGSLCGSMNVLAGGTLGGTGTVCDTTNAGIMAPGNSIGTLIIAGDYIGNGGLLEIEAELGGDASSADRLVIAGDTSGSTNVRVINIGGTGAQTIEGIKVVDVGGASNGSFSLLGDYVFEGDQAVVAGAYAYRLVQNGVSTATDGDWYLRSAFVPEAPGTPPVSPGEPGAPPPAQTPLYSPAVPLYEAYAGVLQSFNQLGTLQQRVGNRSWSSPSQGSEASGGAAAISPIWARIEAAHAEFDPATSTTGTDYDANLWKLQAGLDGLLNESAAGALIAGVTVHYGTVSSDVSSIFGAGSIDTTGYGFGATLTWYGKNGFYVDAQTQLTWFDSDVASTTLGRTLADGNSGFGYGLGIEAGQKIALQGNWSLTPQAQLAYASVDFDDFADPFGAAVSLDGSDSLIGRIGLSADYDSEWKDAAGQVSRSHVYGIANLYYDFLDGSDVKVSGINVASKRQAFWGGLGIGGSLNWADDRYSVYGEALARTSLEDFGDSYSLAGTVGFKVKW